MKDNKDSTARIHEILKGGPPEKSPVLGDSPKLTKKEKIDLNKPKELSDEELEIMKKSFSGVYGNYDGLLKSIPEDSMLNAPRWIDEGGNVVQEFSNRLNP